MIAFGEVWFERLGHWYVPVAITIAFLVTLLWARERLMRIMRTALLPMRYVQFETKAKGVTTNGEAISEDGVAEKRASFLNLANISFHYADKPRIRDFCNDYFREPTDENVVEERAKGVSGEVKATLPTVLEVKGGAKHLTKATRSIKLPDTSLSGMFLRYQQETIEKAQVSLCLEDADVELSELEGFDALVEELRENYELVFDEEALETCRAKLRAKAAQRTLRKLENASGAVLIEGAFRISEDDEKFYKCTYTHPISSYGEGPAANVLISFLIAKSEVEAHVTANYAQSVGQEIRLRVYGDVWQALNCPKGIWEVRVTPLAVY